VGFASMVSVESAEGFCFSAFSVIVAGGGVVFFFGSIGEDVWERASSCAACHKPSAVSFFFSNIIRMFDTLLALSLDAVAALEISAEGRLSSFTGVVLMSMVKGLLISIVAGF